MTITPDIQAMTILSCHRRNRANDTKHLNPTKLFKILLDFYAFVRNIVNKVNRTED